LKFEVVNTCKDADEMLDIEFDLIQMHKPRMNKIMKRKQNYNAPLAASTTQARVGDKTWCQRCFKRHDLMPEWDKSDLTAEEFLKVNRARIAGDKFGF